MKITHDIHCHTHLSLCGSDSATIAYYTETAKKLGLTTIGISDHLWDSAIPLTEDMKHSRFAHKGIDVTDWYRQQDVAHCRRVLQEIADTDTAGVRFLFGAEADYCPGRGVALSEQAAQEMDFIIVPNSHTHHLMKEDLYMPYEKHGEYMLRAAMDICTGPIAPYVTSLAHPFDAVACPYPVAYILDTITDAQLREVFCAAKEANIAAEINTSSYEKARRSDIQNHFMTRVLSVARACGCKFTFGSDSHSAGAQDPYLETLDAVIQCLGLRQEDVLELEVRR